MRSKLLVFGCVIALGACREADGPLGGAAGSVQVSSDPLNARIFVDNEDTGLRTPDTVTNISGAHDVFAVLDSAGAQYVYGEHVVVHGIEPFVMSGPLHTRCLVSPQTLVACYVRNRIPASGGNITLSMNATGAMMTEDGNGDGLNWPAGSSDSYVSNAMPLIAAKVGGKQVSLGMYDISTMAGRPALSIDASGGGLRTDQKAWIVPIVSSLTATTIRGIEVREQTLIDPSQPDVVLIKLTYRNITNSPLYQKLDARGAALGTAGLTYDDVYIGYGMDPDIGSAADDAVTYDPALHAVFAYDGNFSDNVLAQAQAGPGMVGLRMLSAPGGAPILLNAYFQQSGTVGLADWHAGETSESIGWSVMSGTGSYAPDDPDPTIGTIVAAPNDVRMLVSAGPYALRPAEELTIVVAVAMASPTAGAFTQGVSMPAGDPHDTTRPIMAAAAALRQKLSNASSLLSKIGSQ